MSEFIAGIAFWHWWVLAAILTTIEVFAPTTVLLWPGVAAATVGVVLFAVPDLGWQLQVVLFAVLSVAAALSWRAYLKRRPAPVADPGLNRRAQQYVGQVFTLAEPIVGGRGKLKVGDTMWKVEGRDLAVGQRVKVTAVDGVVLRIEAA